jgi:hypothetical protein
VDRNTLWILGAFLLLGGGGYAVYNMTRGLRNNNPGNIIYDGTAWEGLANPPSDGTFCIFTDPTYGIRAMGQILTNYVTADGIAPTVTAIINRWAPPSANNTAAYVTAVANSLGVDPNASLDMSSVMPALVAAIITQENGLQPYAVNTIASGLALA